MGVTRRKARAPTRSQHELGAAGYDDLGEAWTTFCSSALCSRHHDVTVPIQRREWIFPSDQLASAARQVHTVRCQQEEKISPSPGSGYVGAGTHAQ
jgi:hypothetical protein